MSESPRTWHFGVVARYWAEFNVAEPAELAYWRAAIETSGEPVLDVGCGTGRLLIPLLAEGIDIDGTDISPDMLAYVDAAAKRVGRTTNLAAAANHELDLERRYRTVIACGTFGIGGSREQDLEALRRMHRHLVPGGTLVLDQHLAYDRSEAEWLRWLPGHGFTSEPWPDQGERRRAADGDEFELAARISTFDALESRLSMDMRARLWRDGTMLAEEIGSLDECLYLVPEIRLMLGTAGFRDVTVQSAYTGQPATADDDTVVFVARR